MIKKSSIGLALVLAIVFSSCDSIGNLFTVKVDADFKVDLPVNVTTPLKSGAQSFDVTETFNPSDEPSIADYVARIKAINLQTLTAMFGSLSRESFTVTGATFTISAGAESVSYTFPSVTVTDGTFLSISDENGKFDKISNMLTGLNEVTVQFAGSVDASPTTFTLFTILGSVVDAGI